MKTSTNTEELKMLDACQDWLETFINAHGDNEVLLSDALESNGWDDFWWYVSENYDSFSECQKKDLRLLGCDWAESVLHIFEKEYPNDDRPRKAIQASRGYAEGKIDDAARAAAWAAARAAAWAAVRKEQINDLKTVLKKWESQCNEK